MSKQKTQRQQIFETFQFYGYRMTLGQILKYPWGYEARARFAELRQEGHEITYHRGKTPSEGLYVMTPPADINGQYEMVM